MNLQEYELKCDILILNNAKHIEQTDVNNNYVHIANVDGNECHIQYDDISFLD